VPVSRHHTLRSIHPEVSPVRFVAVVLAALVLVLGAQALGRADAPPGVPAWEYRLVAIAGAGDTSNPAFEAAVGSSRELAKELEGNAKALGFEVAGLGQVRTLLTEAGAAGWEIVSMDGTVWVFKRPLR
jgi:hypothetical protein